MVSEITPILWLTYVSNDFPNLYELRQCGMDRIIEPQYEKYLLLELICRKNSPGAKRHHVEGNKEEEQFCLRPYVFGHCVFKHTKNLQL